VNRHLSELLASTVGRVLVNAETRRRELEERMRLETERRETEENLVSRRIFRFRSSDLSSFLVYKWKSVLEAIVPWISIIIMVLAFNSMPYKQASDMVRMQLCSGRGYDENLATHS
jgi:hypothetical protein